MNNFGNYGFIPDRLIAQWGKRRWERIRANMEQSLILERKPELDGYIYYDKQQPKAERGERD